MNDDDYDIFMLAGVEIYREARPRPRRLSRDAVAASLRRGFVLENEGVTLPWKVPMEQLERVASTRALDEFGLFWDREYGWGPVSALGGMHLPMVFVTDTRGFGLFDSLQVIFPRSAEQSDAGLELFERLHADLEARLGPAPRRALPDDLSEARWQIGAVLVALGSRGRPLRGSDVHRTWITINLDPAMPFECEGPPIVEPVIAALSAPPVAAAPVDFDPRPPQGLPSRQDGLREVSVARVPILGATYRFSTPGEAPCAERTYGLQTWFVGSGVRAAEHPFVLRGDGFIARDILRSTCGACDSHDVLVVAFQTSASMGGDAYYSLELRCEACGAYTSFAFDDR